MKIETKNIQHGRKTELEVDLMTGFVTHKSAPKNYPKVKTEYADPKNFKYPIDSEERVRSAWSYINMPKNQAGYSSDEISGIKSRIKHAGTKFGIDFQLDQKKTV